MTKSDTWETGLLSLLFENADFTEVGDAAGLQGSTTTGSLYLSLHTAALDDASTQATSETTYDGYQRAAVSRATGWTVTNNSVSPAADVDFGECTGTPGGAVTYFAVGTTGTSGQAGKVLYWGQLSPSITMATGVIPRIKTTSAITED